MKQLSEGERKCERERKAHKYLLDCAGNKLIFAAIDDRSRTLSADEQVISVLEGGYTKGYDVTLVTCNHNQAVMADLRRFKCLLFEGNTTCCANNVSKETSK